MPETIKAFLSDWAAAERTGDTGTRARLLTDDFSTVGPLGPVLSRATWLGRHGQGMVYERFGLEDSPSSAALRLAGFRLSFIAGTKGPPPMAAPTGLATNGARTQADREEG